VKAIVVLCVLATAAAAQPGHAPDTMQLGGSPVPPVVSVLTFGEGDPIFEKWGHAALCLAYPHRETVCFNWGVTDFDATADLVWGFLRGEQLFWMEPEPRSDMLGFYEYEDRDIYEQTLALSPEAARKVENGVLAQLDGPWRYYIYDHFADNCTTRIRGLIDDATDGALRAGTDRAYPLTFRELGYRGLAEHPILRGLSDFLVGRALDAHPTVWKAMFHPDVFRQEIAAQLGVAPKRLHARTGPPFPDTGPSGALPMLAFAALFVVPIVIRRNRGTLAWATVWLAGWGAILWTLVAISGIAGIRYNEVALVLVPVDIVLPFLGEARRERYAKWRVAELLAISLLRAIGVLRQPLWVPIVSAIIPLSVAARFVRRARPDSAH
jgi:hypothetical protein